MALRDQKSFLVSNWSRFYVNMRSRVTWMFIGERNRSRKPVCGGDQFASIAAPKFVHWFVRKIALTVFSTQNQNDQKKNEKENKKTENHSCYGCRTCPTPSLHAQWHYTGSLDSMLMHTITSWWILVAPILTHKCSIFSLFCCYCFRRLVDIFSGKK